LIGCAAWLDFAYQIQSQRFVSGGLAAVFPLSERHTGLEQVFQSLSLLLIDRVSFLGYQNFLFVQI
jgi:hypothetical protein